MSKLTDAQYSELVQKLAGEIIDDAIAGLEKQASEEEVEPDAEALVKQAYAAYEESQMMKQAAAETFEEAQLNEDAALAVLDELGINVDDIELDESDESEIEE